MTVARMGGDIGLAPLPVVALPVGILLVGAPVALFVGLIIDTVATAVFATFP